MKENLKDKIDNFLKENKINITGGIIKTEEELSLVLNNIAMSDLKKGKLQKSLYFASKALEFDSKNYYAMFIKGLIYRASRNFNEAIKLFDEYYELSKESLSLIHIGFCYAELGDIDNALDYFRKGEQEFTEEEKHNYSSLMCTVYECIGNIYMNRENVLEFKENDKFSLNYKLAIKYYKMSLKINKKNHLLLNKLAACYHHFDDEKKALYCYEEAVKIAPQIEEYKGAIEEMKEQGIVSEIIEF
ncbi:tetratricopeptide repeat protein [Clostridium sp. ZBS15]|uniref:tetratricopeptide repeat protein n=1 Tax=Clostridium sp. ZBS15 TaxID=2949969 RepID=UPI0020794961|nr:tetratricopeptide repeat protein [Clostridium sp. ZBS15]